MKHFRTLDEKQNFQFDKVFSLGDAEKYVNI